MVFAATLFTFYPFMLALTTKVFFTTLLCWEFFDKL